MQHCGDDMAKSGSENFKLAQKEQFDIIEGDDVEQEVDQRNSRERSLFQAKDLLDGEPEREWEGEFHKCACVKCREDGVAGLRSL